VGYWANWGIWRTVISRKGPINTTGSRESFGT